MSATTETGTDKARAGTPVRMRMPPKLLARVDALVAAQPEPKPTRGKVIKELMREALSARRARRRARQASAGRPRVPVKRGLRLQSGELEGSGRRPAPRGFDWATAPSRGRFELPLPLQRQLA